MSSQKLASNVSFIANFNSFQGIWEVSTARFLSLKVQLLQSCPRVKTRHQKRHKFWPFWHFWRSRILRELLSLNPVCTTSNRCLSGDATCQCLNCTL